MKKKQLDFSRFGIGLEGFIIEMWVYDSGKVCCFTKESLDLINNKPEAIEVLFELLKNKKSK